MFKRQIPLPAVMISGLLLLFGPIPVTALAQQEQQAAGAANNLTASDSGTPSIGSEPQGAAALPVIQIPQLHKLVGLQAGDHLNIRRQPTAASEDLGDIAADAGAVDIIDIDESGSWGKIVWQDSNAWVSLKYLEVDNSGYLQSARVPVGLQCVGTEPFWNYRVLSESSAALELPDRGDPPELILDMTIPSSNRVNYPVALLAASQFLSTTSLLRDGLCFDGMSDREYGWTVDILFYQKDQQMLLSGCCHLPLPGDD